MRWRHRGDLNWPALAEIVTFGRDELLEAHQCPSGWNSAVGLKNKCYILGNSKILLEFGKDIS